MEEKSMSEMVVEARKKAGLTQSKASEMMSTISEDRLSRIEKGKINISPEDVLEMATAYKRPDLCNYFCTHNCAIGKKMVEPIKVSQLSDIILQMLASLNAMDQKKNRLIEIAADGKISDDELEDFATIQLQLDTISQTVSTLKLWVNTTIAQGDINEEAYEKVLEALKNKK